MYHISRFPKQKRKGIQKNRTILYGLYVRGKSDLNIEVPYGPIRPQFGNIPDFRVSPAHLFLKV